MKKSCPIFLSPGAEDHTELAGFSIFLLLLLFSSLNACSPVQGYLGPPLPKEQVATVYLKSCDSKIENIRASTDGIQFSTNGITVLPDEKTFDLSVNLLGKKYECTHHKEFDSYGYDNCWRRREEAIRKKKSKIPDCHRYSYESEYYMCNQDYTQYVCLLTHKVARSQEYSVCAFSSAFGVHARLSPENSSVVLVMEECMKSTTETKRSKFSTAY